MHPDSDRAPARRAGLDGARLGGRHLLTAAWLLAALAACGPRPAELNIVLERAREGQADEATLANLNALRVTVREVESTTPEVFPPFEIDRSQSIRLAAEVPPGVDFYVDVWGCASADACDSQQVIARGCTDVIQIPQGQSDLVVVVPMDDWPLPPGGKLCPPDISGQ